MVVVSATLWDDTLVVLASKDTTSKGGPDGGAISILREESSVFTLESVSNQHAVLALLNNGLVEVESLANLNSLSNSISGPL